MSSPTTAAQERRKGQYKALLSCRTPDASSAARRLFSSGSSAGSGRPISAAACSSKRSAQAFFSQVASAHSQDSTKLFLREQFQARCRKLARKARHRAVSEKRGCGSSDAGGFGIGDEEMDCDEEETEDDIMQDEVCFRLFLSVR